MQPDITTILTTFRRPKLLTRAIESVLAQDYSRFQLKVYDDSSGDETADIVSNYCKKDARVKYIYHSPPVGSLRNFHLALHEVTTPFFSIFSDDDILLPGFYSTVMRGFELHPDIAFAAGATIQMDELGQIIDVPLDRWPEGYHEPGKGAFLMLRNKHPDWAGIIFRREWILESGGTDVSTGLIHDVDFELRAACRHAIWVTREPCAIFLIHPSQSSQGWQLGDVEGLLKLFQNIKSETMDAKPKRAVLECLRSQLIGRFWQLGLKAIRKKNSSAALKFSSALLQLKARIRAHMLGALVRCTKNNFVAALYERLCLIRDRLRESRRSLPSAKLQERYGQYARFLSRPYKKEQ